MTDPSQKWLELRFAEHLERISAGTDLMAEMVRRVTRATCQIAGHPDAGASGHISWPTALRVDPATTPLPTDRALVIQAARHALRRATV